MECYPTHLSERLFSSGKNKLPVANCPVFTGVSYFRQLANNSHDIVFWMSEMGEIEKKRHCLENVLDKWKPGFIPKMVLFVQSSS